MVATARIQTTGYRVNRNTATFKIIPVPATSAEYTLTVNTIKQGEQYLEQNIIKVNGVPNGAGTLTIGTGTPATVTLAGGMTFGTLVTAFQSGLTAVSNTMDGVAWTLSSDTAAQTITLSCIRPLLNYTPPSGGGISAIGGTIPATKRLVITGTRSLLDSILYTNDAVMVNGAFLTSVTPTGGSVTGVYYTMPDADLQGSPSWIISTTIAAVSIYTEDSITKPYGYIKCTLGTATSSLLTVTRQKQ